MPAAELLEGELAAWGAEFARGLRLPACIALSGELGAGKTTLVRAIVNALGGSEPVTSPTYSLVHEYSSPLGPVMHLDLYRLTGPDQLPQLGWEEMMRSGGLLLIEWPERAEGVLPAETFHLKLEHIASRPEARRLEW